MAIDIPSDASQTFQKVLDALGGENYSYYLFDVKKVATTEKQKIRVGMKVYVPLSRRSIAANNIQSALEKDKVISVVKDEKQLDVSIIGDVSGKIIRLDIKPESGKGSGGGAAATLIQEGAQCVYAAMRYYCGDVKNFTEEDFECGMKYVDAPGLKLIDVLGLPAEWKEGSWKGANEIFNTVKGKGWTFVRGDNLVEKELSDAFKRVKKQTNLSSEDKWNPADIWMVKDKNEVANKLKEENTIDCLNNYIQQARAKGDFVGISLKKLEGTISMKLLNDDTPAERKANEAAHYAKYDLTFDNKRKKDPYPMDVYYYYGSGNFQKFQARNFGGPTKGDWKLELKGKSAAQGKIQGQKVRDLLKDAKFNVSKLTEPTFAESDPNASGAKKITDEIYNLLSEFNAKNFTANTNTKNIIASQPKAWRYSKLAGLRMLKWLGNLPRKEANRAMKELYLYASSQSDKSSVYWKLS